MPDPLWSVTSATKILEEATVDAPQRAQVTYTLRFEGKPVHHLQGANGKTALEEVARDFNSKDYRPKFVNGKMVHEMSMKEKLKSAQDWTQELPL